MDDGTKPAMRVNLIPTKVVQISPEKGLTVADQWTEIYNNEVLQISAIDVDARVYMPTRVFDPQDAESEDWAKASLTSSGSDYLLFDIKAGQSLTFIPREVDFQLKYFVTRVLVKTTIISIERAPVIIIHKKISS